MGPPVCLLGVDPTVSVQLGDSVPVPAPVLLGGVLLSPSWGVPRLSWEMAAPRLSGG